MYKEKIFPLAVDLFGRLSKTKEEAFLKGVLYGYGSHSACPTPNWELMKEFPDTIDIEQEMREMFEKIHKRDIENTQRLLERSR